MREALRIARAGLEVGELPIGAIMTLDDEVISARHTSEIMLGRWLTHAELLVLDEVDRSGCKRRREMRLYTTVEPCLMRLGAAMTLGVGEIVYGLASPTDGAVTLVRGWQRDTAGFEAYRTPVISGGALRDECRALFDEYLRRHSSGGMWQWAKTLVCAP